MDLRRIAVLLPCDSLGDFPTHLTEQDASAALHNWTAAWRPELIAACGRLPCVWSAYSPPDADSARGCVLLIPELSRSVELDNWRDGVLASEDSGTVLIESLADRRAIIPALRQPGVQLTTSGDHWQEEFYALGYAYLQVELLTHNLAFASVINTDELESAIVHAAQAAVEGRDAEIETHLSRAYDLLQQVRDHSYPAKNYLIDLVLVGETTLGSRLHGELSEESPKCFVLSASIAAAIGQLAESNKLANFCLAATLGPGVDAATLSPLRLRDEVRGAIAALQQLTNNQPAAFVQLTPGLAPRLPSLLASVETPLVVAPLEGAPPVFGRVRASLETPGGAVQALAAAPQSAALATSLLGLAGRLSESLYRDGVCTQVYAAWAGCRSELFNDLRRVARRSHVLGEMVTLAEYFDQTQGVDSAAFPPDDQLGPDWNSWSSQESPTLDDTATLPGMAACSEMLGGDSPAEEEASPSKQELMESLANALRRGDEPCRLVVNHLSYARPVLIGEAMSDGLLDLKKCDLTAVTPGLGYRLSPAETAAAKPRVEATPEGLRNACLEIVFDENTGGIRTARVPLRRRNRFSQKLVVRREPGFIDVPLNVRLEPVEVIAGPPDRAVATTAGDLFDLKGGLVARFRQTMLLFEGWDRLFLDIEIDTSAADTTLDRLSFASRFALPDVAWAWSRGVQSTRLAAPGRRFVATDYAQAASGEQSITFASSTGNRWLTPTRMADCLLPVRPRGRSICRLAVALDERRPLRVALDLRSQSSPVPGVNGAGSPGDSGWFAHLDAANVQVLEFLPLPDGQPGRRLTLAESAGRTTDARLRLARRPTGAWRLDADGRRAGPLDTLGEALAVPLAPHEMLSLEVTW